MNRYTEQTIDKDRYSKEQCEGYGHRFSQETGAKMKAYMRTHVKLGTLKAIIVSNNNNDALAKIYQVEEVPIHQLAAPLPLVLPLHLTLFELPPLKCIHCTMRNTRRGVPFP